MKRSGMVTALLVITVLAACGQPTSRGADAPDDNVLAAAVQAATDAGTVRFRMHMRLPTQTSPMDMVADGEMDLRTSDANMRMVMTGAYLEGASLEMEIRMTSEDIYMHMPFLPPGARVGPWFHTTVDEMGRSMGVDMSSMMNSGSDPSHYLDVLRGATDVEMIGTDTIRGVDATRYRATLDLERFAADVAMGSVGEELKEAFAGATLPVQVWVDDSGRPIRQTATVDYSKLDGEIAEALPGTAEFAMDYLEWGVLVEVKTPPARQTSDLSELAELGA